jgi:DNA-directed RNA polymerase subunit M/transcription elongation factor TFIIS
MLSSLQFSNDAIICPHCGHAHHEWWEVAGEFSDRKEVRTECDNCGREFMACFETCVEITSYPLEDEL